MVAATNRRFTEAAAGSVTVGSSFLQLGSCRPSEGRPESRCGCILGTERSELSRPLPRKLRDPAAHELAMHGSLMFAADNGVQFWWRERQSIKNDGHHNFL